VICWLLGLGSVLSFNLWSDVFLIGKMTFFDTVDYLSQNIMLPLGGLLIALFVGYVAPKDLVRDELGITSGLANVLWNVSIKVIAPLGVLAVFAKTIYDTLVG